MANPQCNRQDLNEIKQDQLLLQHHSKDMETRSFLIKTSNLLMTNLQYGHHKTKRRKPESQHNLFCREVKPKTQKDSKWTAESKYSLWLLANVPTQDSEMNQLKCSIL